MALISRQADVVLAWRGWDLWVLPVDGAGPRTGHGLRVLTGLRPAVATEGGTTVQQLTTDSTRPTHAFCDGGGALCPLEVADYRRLGWAGRVDWEDIMRPRRFARRCSEVFRAAPVALRSSRSALPSGAGP